MSFGQVNLGDCRWRCRLKTMGKLDEKREQRMLELIELEKEYYDTRGYQMIAGVDEAGRGPLAGPVVAACVVFRPGTWFAGVDDSKKLSAKRRDKIEAQIRETALAVGVGVADVQTIEDINILEATRKASVDAFNDLGMQPDFLFTDSMELPVDIERESLVGADRKIYCVAAASIVAKVFRDRIMDKLDKQYPEYGFAHNRGYGTKEHCEALRKFGPSPVHRPSFLRKILGSDKE